MSGRALRPEWLSPRGRLAWVGAAAAMALLLVACNGGDEETTGPAPLSISTSSLPDGVQGEAYDATINATGGTAPMTWDEPTDSFDDSTGAGAAGTPCEGLTLDLDATGRSTTISGTPVNTGDCGPFDIRVRDSGSPRQSDTATFTITIAADLQITTTSVPNGEEGTAYAATVDATGGTGPYSWDVVSGSLPPGLSLSASTTLSVDITGTPTAGGSFDFTLEVTDSADPAQSATQSFSAVLIIQVTTTGIPDAVVGEAYNSGAMSVVGEAPPVTWSASGLPSGFDIDSGTGEITGTAIVGQEGDHAITVTVTDSDAPTPRSDSQDLTLTIVADLLITTTLLVDGTEGQAYNDTVDATGGTAPYAWSEPTTFFDSDGNGVADTPCEGLQLDFTQTDLTLEISGTPIIDGDCGPFTIRIEDSSATSVGVQFDEQDLTITVKVGPVEIVTTSLVDAQVNSSYSDEIQGTGGIAPYTWAEPTGFFDANGDGTVDTPCQGLTIDLATDTDTTTVTGTPEIDGDCGPFDVTLTDDVGDSDLQTLTITVNPAAEGRNDSISTATPLTTNGDSTIRASISPYADPLDTTNPDQDFYELTATAGDTVTIEITAQRLSPASPLDSVIEIQDINGDRFPDDCRDEGTVSGVDGSPDPTPNDFDDPCLNDDIDLGVIRDSKLEFLVPGDGTVTFFIRVLDWRGDARPDLIYDLTIQGAD